MNALQERLTRRLQEADKKVHGRVGARCRCAISKALHKAFMQLALIRLGRESKVPCKEVEQAQVVKVSEDIEYLGFCCADPPFC